MKYIKLWHSQVFNLVVSWFHVYVIQKNCTCIIIFLDFCCSFFPPLYLLLSYTMHLMHFDLKIWLYTCMPTFTPDKVCKIGVGPKEREPHVERLRYIEALFFSGNRRIECGRFSPEKSLSEVFCYSWFQKISVCSYFFSCDVFYCSLLPPLTAVFLLARSFIRKMQSCRETVYDSRISSFFFFLEIPLEMMMG